MRRPANHSCKRVCNSALCFPLRSIGTSHLKSRPLIAWNLIRWSIDRVNGSCAAAEANEPATEEKKKKQPASLTHLTVSGYRLVLERLRQTGGIRALARVLDADGATGATGSAGSGDGGAIDHGTEMTIAEQMALKKLVIRGCALDLQTRFLIFGDV